MEKKYYIEVNNLTKIIKKKKVLSDINLKLVRGKIYGFRGRNGSGKSMLFRAICGLIRPSEGSVTINGKLLVKEISFPESLGAIIEYPGFLPNYTGLKNLKMIAGIKNKIPVSNLRQIMEAVELDPNDKRKYKKYSLGMKQRLGIAQAIMENPDLIILDEPTNALDQYSIQNINQFLIDLKNKNKLILISSHEKKELDLLCDEIFTLHKGKLISTKNCRSMEKVE